MAARAEDTRTQTLKAAGSGLATTTSATSSTDTGCLAGREEGSVRMIARIIIDYKSCLHVDHSLFVIQCECSDVLLVKASNCEYFIGAIGF